MSGRKKQIRADFAGATTLALLEKVAAEALRLGEENKRLTAELKTVLRRTKPAVKKAAKQALKGVAAPAEDEAVQAPVVEKKAGLRRQALGMGLARFLGARRPL